MQQSTRSTTQRSTAHCRARQHNTGQGVCLFSTYIYVYITYILLTYMCVEQETANRQRQTANGKRQTATRTTCTPAYPYIPYLFMLHLYISQPNRNWPQPVCLSNLAVSFLLIFLSPSFYRVRTGFCSQIGSYMRDCTEYRHAFTLKLYYVLT